MSKSKKSPKGKGDFNSVVRESQDQKTVVVVWESRTNEMPIEFLKYPRGDAIFEKDKMIIKIKIKH